MSDHLADVRKYSTNVNEAAVTAIVKYCGIALSKPDSALVSGTDPKELATVVVASIRHAPGIAFGDIIGANVAMCLVAVGLGAVLTPLRFTPRVLLYALAAIPISAISLTLLWDGQLSRIEGLTLISLYVIYVGAIWFFEKAPPTLGEVEELLGAEEELAVPSFATERGRVGLELVCVLLGVAAMAAGGTLLVEAVLRITSVEDTQTKLGLTVVGLATAFELVVLVWSASKRDITEVALAGVVGSFGYNMTMSLGVGALIHPLQLAHADGLHLPALLMMGALTLVIALALPTQRLNRLSGATLLCSYPLFVFIVVLR